MRGWSGLVVAGCLWCGVAFCLEEEQAKPAVTKKVKNEKGTAKPNLPEEREASALAFVKEHHPELGEILAELKENKPQEYQRGLREIQGVTQRISRFREKQPERYELEVQVWKAGSRARLLAAQGAMSGTPSDETKQKIKEELKTQEEGRLKLLEVEQADLKKRLATVENQLEKNRGRMDEIVESGLKKLLNSAVSKNQILKKQSEMAARRKAAKAAVNASEKTKESAEKKDSEMKENPAPAEASEKQGVKSEEAKKK